MRRRSPAPPPTTPTPAPAPPRQHGTTGVALIVLGVIALIGSLVQPKSVGLLFLPALALAFVIWGLTSRNARLLIPGGVLGGIGVGTLLAETIYKSTDLVTTGGTIALFLGLGFLVIIPLERFIQTQPTQKPAWELLPGLVLVVLGIGLLVEPIRKLLTTAGKYWPIALIVLGAIFVWENRRNTTTP